MNRGGDEADATWLHGVLRRSVENEQSLRELNSRYVPLSQALKAVTALNDQLPILAWEAERKARRLPSKSYAVRLLWRMTELRPPPEMPADEHVRYP